MSVLSERYPIRLFFDHDDDGYIAVAPDLPGCSAFGKTRAEALNQLADAIEAWMEAAQKAGNKIPQPSSERSELPSGKILLRVPRSLHADLATLAESEDVSLNQCILSMLSAGVAAKGSSLSIGTSLSRSTGEQTSHPVYFYSAVAKSVQSLDLLKMSANKPVVFDPVYRATLTTTSVAGE